MYAASVLEAIGRTPLVEVDELSPEEGARIVVKLEGANPTGSMKDRMARSVIERAERDGRLEPGRPVVELTGGSTGSSLALVCGVKGYPLTLITADCFAAEKRHTMRALGADVEVLTTPNGRVYPGLVEDLKERVDAHVAATGAYSVDQFNNPDGPRGYHGLGEEILAGCPEVSDFVMAVGTGGCAMGTARALHDGASDVRVTLVEPEESAVLSTGQAGAHHVEGVALGFVPPLLDDALYDDVVAIPEAEARAVARRAAAEAGVFAGTSSGLNLAAAIRVAERRPPDATVVTVAVDTGLKYLAGGLYRSGPADDA